VRRGQLRLIAIAAETGREACYFSVSAVAKHREVLLSVGCSTRSTRKLRSAAPGGRLLNERKITVRPWTICENGIIADSDAASLRRCLMTALYIFACVGLIVALGYIGVSWAVAGAGLCVFATIALCWIAGRQGP
jgi:hypothetical protein